MNNNSKKFNNFWWNSIFLILSIFILYVLLHFTDDIDPRWKYGKYLQYTILVALVLNYVFIIVLFVDYLIQIKPLLKEKYLIIRGICIKYFKRFRKKKDEIEPVVKNEESLTL